jgi:hypothetical protein
MYMLQILTRTAPDIDFTINRENIVRCIRPFAATMPTFYLLFVIPFALAGYIALLLFPLLSIWLYLEFISSLGNSSGYQQWSDTLLYGSVLLISFLVTVSLVRIRFTHPAGIAVNNENTPGLTAFIEHMQRQYGRPRIGSILITRDNQIKVTRTPVSWFPVAFKNTLQIGLPTLLCTSPLEFKGSLAREIARLSCEKNPVTGWLLKLHSQWADYYRHLQRQEDPVLKPLVYFFRYYSPLYNALSFFAARRAEIRADRYMLEVMEDDDAIISIVQSIIYQKFLEEKYWPLVNSQPKDGVRRLFLPYRKMSTTLRKNVQVADVTRWVDHELVKYGDTLTTLPPLKTRLRLLGHEFPIFPPALRETAAEEYLDTTTLNLLISSFDTSWARRAGYTLTRQARV